MNFNNEEKILTKKIENTLAINYPEDKLKIIFITDGSTVPANVGVNPSLTITAMAEEAISHIPAKQEPR